MFWRSVWHIHFPPFFKRHQGFGVLSVILANHSIKLLTSLFQDLQVEALHRVRKHCWRVLYCFCTFLLFSFYEKWLSVYLPQGWASDGPPAELNIMAQSTSIQRVQRLIDSVPLTNLLFTLLSTSYKKVWNWAAVKSSPWQTSLWWMSVKVGLVLLLSGVRAAEAKKRLGQQRCQCLHWLQHILRRWL